MRRAEEGCARPGIIYMLTVTAPGEEQHQRLDPKRDGRWANSGHVHALPHWRKRNTTRPDCACCLPAAGLEAWNPTAGACWNRLRLSLSRLPGVDGDLEYLRVVEVQDGKRQDHTGCPPGCEHGARGALHHHVLVRVPVELDPAEVQRYAIAAGYGCSMDLSIMPAARAARYVAKYATKGYTGRGDVPWRDYVLDKDTGELVTRQTAAYRTVSQSKNWGMTLRQIRDQIKAERQRARDALVLVDPSGNPDSPELPGQYAGPDPPT